MSDIIHLLPDSVSNQIAAGEVIQRPASIVKELMENAVDAKAKNIKLLVKNAGKSLIQVIDDGMGMSSLDARKCFEKHATSKIRNIEDLFEIRSMGFRGEAMASIAAVSQVELKTKREEDELATRILIQNSNVDLQEFCQAPNGTSVSAKNLFFNIPARRSFLKSDAVETKHIIEEFQRVSLSHPHISFQMFNNDYQLFELKECNLRKRIVGVFGDNYNERLVPVEEESDSIRIFGFVGKPDYSKRTRGEQYIFVNGRFVKSAYLNHAVFSNYHELIPKDEFPMFVLFIDIDPAMVDINVHPSKHEVKFHDEKLVYTFVNAGVKHSLSQFSVTPTLDFEREAGFDKHSSFGAILPKTNAIPRKDQGSYVPQNKQRNSVENWEKLYDIAKTDSFSVTVSQSEKEIGLNDEIRSEPHQIHNRYIISQIKSGFILIDQHLAHQRILYERYRRALEHNKLASQKQLFPQTIELNAEDTALMFEILDDINNLGFDIQEFGNNNFVVHGFPADIESSNEGQIIDQLLEQFKTNFKVEKLSKRENLARSLAKGSAIKWGQSLQIEEMRQLIDELFACEEAYFAPGGKPVFITFENELLAQQFEARK